MTLRLLALARGRSYSTIHRIAVSAGVKMRGERNEVNLTPADIRKIDDAMERLRKYDRDDAKAPDPEAVFQAHRAEWYDQYTEAVHFALDADDFVTLLALGGALEALRIDREWLDAKVDGQRVGAVLLAWCKGLDVDWNPDGTWSGFAGWLEKNGFEAQEKEGGE